MNDISRAISSYLGFGSSPFPRQDRSRIVEEFGAEKASELERGVIAILNEANKIDVDWEGSSLSSAGSFIRFAMKNRYSALSDEALDAIVWQFTYSWK